MLTGLAGSQETERFGEGDSRATIVHTELAIDIGGMHLDRAGRDHQFARNLLVGEVLIQQAQDVQFAVGQRFYALLLQQLFL